MSKKHRVPMKSGIEYDVLTKARRLYTYLYNNSSLKSYAKNKHNRRIRRDGNKKERRALKGNFDD